ncbi:MAG: HAD family hydrolase [Nitrospinaceae bacterium]
MKKISLIVYDFDGTLVDTLDDITTSVNLTLKELGERTLDRETIQTCVGRGVVTLMTRALDGTAFTDIGQAVTLFREHYARHLMDHTRFYPNCRETVEYFSHKNQAICSNKPEDFVRKILENLDCLDPFQAIIGGDSFPTRKPDPQGLRHLIRKFGLEPGEVLIVGDSPLDIETGKNARVLTCAVTYGMGDTVALQAARPNWIIGDLAELKRLIPRPAGSE